VLKLGADAAATIAARTPLMADPSSASNRAEITRMVMEKPPAFADAAWRWAGKGPALMQPWQRFLDDQSKLNADLVAAIVRDCNPTKLIGAQQSWFLGSLRLAARLSLELTASSVVGFSASLVPIHREASANARRLGSRGAG
jgi:hypothetical protein